MQENTNKAIAYNTIVLYVRLIITSVCSLFISRYSLQALGVTDYGLFSVVGGFISFIAIFNTIMLSTSNRFIAVAIGRGNETEINKQFNVNLIIHIAIALLTLIVVIIIGDWYIMRYINYEGDISNAIYVYHITVIGSIITFIGVPYNGLLMAKEKFIVFCSLDVISSILKLIVTYLLVSHFTNKLSMYTWATVILTTYPTLIYYIYCKRHYPSIVKFKFVREKAPYREVLKFSAWVGYGAVATVGKNQGAALIVNYFFNTVMNTALGIATSINSIIGTFAHNVTKPISPQITKSFAAGDRERSLQLLVTSSKMCFLLMLLAAAAFLVEPDWIFTIWLGEVPPFVVQFTTLIIIDALLDSLNSGISELIFASGKIELFQLTINTLRLISIVAAYLLLKMGGPAYSLLYAYIGFTVIAIIVRQWILHRDLNINNWWLFKRSYLPCLIVAIIFVAIIFIPMPIHPFAHIIVVLVLLLAVELFVGFTKNERNVVYGFIRKKNAENKND